MIRVGNAGAAIPLELQLALAAQVEPRPRWRAVMAPRAGEARQGIPVAGERHLEAGLPGLRPVGEHLEDDFPGRSMTARAGELFRRCQAKLRGRQAEVHGLITRASSALASAA